MRPVCCEINKIEVDKILSQLKNKAEKEKFKYRIVDLKNAYNKSVEKLQEIEKLHPKDTNKKIRELKEDMAELDAIWKYIIANYQI
jgi:predicted nucleotide-binding protein (sugar kinase/HSP70/actin superfamily)